MRSEKRQKKTRMINRKYEPDRLSPTRLADAYEKVVPRSIWILKDWSREAKSDRVDKQQVIGG
jgi:hypothetical protein